MPYTYTYGSGTENDPYQVWDADDLNGVRDHLDKYFIQMADIDLISYQNDSWSVGVGNDWTERTDGVGWLPIGDKDNPFIGKYDGDGFKIGNLKIVSSYGVWQDIGLFGRLAGWGEITGLNLTNVYLKTTGERTSAVGSIVGWCAGGHITHSKVQCEIHANPTVASNALAGGVLGGTSTSWEEEVILNNLTVAADVHGTASRVGGISGYVYFTDGVYTNNKVTGKVVGTGLVGGFYAGITFAVSNIEISKHFGDIEIEANSSTVGGFAGQTVPGFNVVGTSINKSCTKGELNGGQGSEIGGFVGYNSRTKFNNCYSRVNLSNINANDVGGFVGANWTNGEVNNCYSTGIVSGTTGSNWGGLIGRLASGAVTNSYYDSTLSGQSDTGKGVPKTTAEMTYPYSDPENVYINWAFYGEDPDPVWAHDKGGSA